MTIIPEVFYDITKKKTSIVSPVIDPKSKFIGKQEKIYPFDYKRDNVKLGNEAKIFNTSCKFGVIICYDRVFSKIVNT